MAQGQTNNTNQICAIMNIDINGKTKIESLIEMNTAVDNIINNNLQIEYDKVQNNKSTNNIMAYIVIEAGMTLEAEKIKCAFEQQIHDIYRRKLKANQSRIKTKQLKIV